MTESVRIVEVGPRDGLQNEARPLPTTLKLALIERLLATGLNTIEATACVSPAWVPQMADHSEIIAELTRRYGDQSALHFPVLVPNRKGYDTAVAAGAREVAVFAAATQTFSQKNTNASIDTVLARCAEVLSAAKHDRVRVRGYVSCALGCPYEGSVSAEQVAHVASRLYTMGCYEISLGDTIGVGTPRQTRQLINTVSRELPLSALALHCHDSYGMAIANICAALDLGVGVIDASISGLGGCPYAKGASGNVATEDVVYLLDHEGVHTPYQLTKLVAVSHWISGELGRRPGGKVSLSLAPPQ